MSRIYKGKKGEAHLLGKINSGKAVDYTLGGKTVPDLSEKQKQFRKWLNDNLIKAKNGANKSGDHTWSDLPGDTAFYKPLLQDVKKGNFNFVKADVYMDTAGKLVGEIGFSLRK